MRKEMSKKISLLLMMLMVMMMVAGCGDRKTDSSKETTTKEVSATGENNGESSGGTEEGNTETADSDFDFNQVFDNIEVNGKHVPFPFTLNDLGDEYSVDSIVEMGDGTCGASLYYKKDEIAMIYMLVNNKEDINNNTVINSLVISHLDTQMIKINGIDCNNNIDDVRNKYVGLEEKYDENNTLSFMRKYSGENYVSHFFNEDGTISNIRLGKGE